MSSARSESKSSVAVSDYPLTIGQVIRKIQDLYIYGALSTSSKNFMSDRERVLNTPLQKLIPEISALLLSDDRKNDSETRSMSPDVTREIIDNFNILNSNFTPKLRNEAQAHLDTKDIYYFQYKKGQLTAGALRQMISSADSLSALLDEFENQLYPNVSQINKNSNPDYFYEVIGKALAERILHASHTMSRNDLDLTFGLIKMNGFPISNRMQVVNSLMQTYYPSWQLLLEKKSFSTLGKILYGVGAALCVGAVVTGLVLGSPWLLLLVSLGGSFLAHLGGIAIYQRCTPWNQTSKDFKTLLPPKNSKPRELAPHNGLSTQPTSIVASTRFSELQASSRSTPAASISLPAPGSDTPATVMSSQSETDRLTSDPALYTPHRI